MPRDAEAEVPDVPAALGDLVKSCLKEKPHQRPDTADSVKQSLLQLSKGQHLRPEQRKRAREDVKKEFALLDVLRETEFGATYLFQETTRKQFFVIKKLAADCRGYTESQVLAGLTHPNLIRVHGTSKNDRVFICVTEYLSHGSLADRLTQGFSEEYFFTIALQILEGLSFAHQKRFVPWRFTSKQYFVCG